MRVITLHSRFHSYSSWNSWDVAFEKIQDGWFNWKLIPVIYFGVITLNSKCQPCSSLNGCQTKPTQISFKIGRSSIFCDWTPALRWSLQKEDEKLVLYLNFIEPETLNQWWPPIIHSLALLIMDVLNCCIMLKSW